MPTYAPYSLSAHITGDTSYHEAKGTPEFLGVTVFPANLPRERFSIVRVRIPEEDSLEEWIRRILPQTVVSRVKKIPLRYLMRSQNIKSRHNGIFYIDNSSIAHTLRTSSSKGVTTFTRSLVVKVIKHGLIGKRVQCSACTTVFELEHTDRLQEQTGLLHSLTTKWYIPCRECRNDIVIIEKKWIHGPSRGQWRMETRQHNLVSAPHYTQNPA